MLDYNTARDPDGKLIWPADACFMGKECDGKCGLLPWLHLVVVWCVECDAYHERGPCPIQFSGGTLRYGQTLGGP